MTDEQTVVTEVPVPLVLRMIIDHHYEQQKEGLRQIEASSLELMYMMNLSPSDGWRLDMEKQKFVKVPK
jgi:hypothetical protein